MWPPGQNHSRTVTRLVACMVVLAIAGSHLPPIQGGPVQAAGKPASLSPGRLSLQAVPSGCTPAVMTGLTVAPATVEVLPLEDQVFLASTMSSCGSSMTQNTSFTWWLSSGSLGALNSSAGSRIAYAACFAPMGGVLHVKATSGSVTLFANSSITVSGQQPSGQSPDPNPTAGAPIPSPGVPWAAIAMVTLVLLAGAVLVVGLRKPKGGD